MKREPAQALLTLWADTIRACGIDERRTPFRDPRLPWSRGFGGDPVLMEAIRDERSWDRYNAGLVHRYMLTLPRDVRDALKERYLGRPVSKLHARTVNGDTMQITWDGPCTWMTVAKRMKRPVRTVRRWVESGERLVVANVRVHKLIRRGRVGEVRRDVARGHRVRGALDEEGIVPKRVGDAIDVVLAAARVYWARTKRRRSA